MLLSFGTNKIEHLFSRRGIGVGLVRASNAVTVHPKRERSEVLRRSTILEDLLTGNLMFEILRAV